MARSSSPDRASSSSTHVPAGHAAPANPARPGWAAPSADELAALDAMGREGLWDFAGQRLKLTNLNKVLFPALDDGRAFTKRDFVRYHATIAPYMLPYLWDRPVNFYRFPDGVQRPGFWSKAVPRHAPDWLTRWDHADARAGRTDVYFVIDSSAALAWTANYGAVELNPWTSTAATDRQPTWALIDVDPGARTTFDEVLVLSRLYRTALDHLGLEARPKVTGKRGVQIWVPIADGYTFDDTRTFVEAVSRAIGNTVPELVSWKWEKRERDGLARLDFTQNAHNKTLVAPFSARPAAGAPVSVPIEWELLDDPDLRPDRWTIETVVPWIEEHGDPLADLIGLPQHLPTL